jgi:hypothetical protein
MKRHSVTTLEVQLLKLNFNGLKIPMLFVGQFHSIFKEISYEAELHKAPIKLPPRTSQLFNEDRSDFLSLVFIAGAIGLEAGRHRRTRTPRNTALW